MNNIIRVTRISNFSLELVCGLRPATTAVCRRSLSATRLPDSTRWSRLMATIAEQPGCMDSTAAPVGITWKEDHYGGCIVDPGSGSSVPHEFRAELSAAVQAWQGHGKRGIWLKMHKERSSLIPTAVELGFDFHHADPGHVMMTLWLPSTPCTLPPNASHQVGVGALVLNEKGEMLLVQERSGPLKGKAIWKMPTGLVNVGEDVTEAVERELLEETGIIAKFDSVLMMRQAHGFAFGKSDMFVLCALKMEPGQGEFNLQESEIEAAAWMPVSEYIEQSLFKGVPLYEQLADRCQAYAEGRYKGFQAPKLDASLPISQRFRKDILMFGQDQATADNA